MALFARLYLFTHVPLYITRAHTLDIVKSDADRVIDAVEAGTRALLGAAVAVAAVGIAISTVCAGALIAIAVGVNKRRRP